MTDAEIDSLALETATKAITEVQKMAPELIQIVISDTDEPCIEFAGVSTKNHGSFRCLYLPLQPIKQLALESGSLFDNFVITLTDKQTGNTSTKTLGEYIPQYRDNAIRFITEAAALFLVGSFYPKMAELLEDGFQDHKMIANATLAEWVVTCVSSDEFLHGKTDMRDEIGQAVARASEQKLTRLRDHFKALPNIVALRGRGGAYNVKHDWTSSELDCLAKNYDELRPVWLDAKQIARAAQRSKVSSRSKDWRVEVLRAYPDLPADLLDRFSHLRADDAKPSDIAIIHAKIKCGVKETYSARELRDKIKSRNLNTELRTST